jgi:hypothetical protein
MVKVKARLTPRSIASTFGLRPHSISVKARLTPRSIAVAFGLRPHSISLSVRPRQSTHSESRKNQCECAAHVYKTFDVVYEDVRWCLVELYEFRRFQGRKCRMETRCEKSSKCVNKIDADARNSRQYVAYLPLAMCVCLRCMRACVALHPRHLPPIRVRLSFVYFCVVVIPFLIYCSVVDDGSCLVDDE